MSSMIHDLIKADVEWHKKNRHLAKNYEQAAGFIAGLEQALVLAEKVPDWEEVCERLMDALTIYGEVFDTLPVDLEDMVGDDDKNARVDAAFESYKSAHLRLRSH